MILREGQSRPIFEALLRDSCRLTGGDRSLLLLCETNGEYTLLGYNRVGERWFGREALDVSESREFFEMADHVLLHGEKWFDETDPPEQRNLSRSMNIACPVTLEDQPIGLLGVQRFPPTAPFHPDDMVYVEALATQLHIYLQRNRLHVAIKEVRGLERNAPQTKIVAKAGSGPESIKIIGRSHAIRRLTERIELVAKTNIPVWIWGESGTGKELCARALHFGSNRSSGPFITENCSAIPESMLESELFGHKRGSFTNAIKDRTGILEHANGGTLFLDEIADMSLAMQAKLLRVLQEREIRPVGSDKKIKIDFRLVTASNRDLSQLIQEGKFRQDLFFRINGMTLKLPPLRERKEDIPLMIEYFANKICKEQGWETPTVPPDIMGILKNHSWPGNVRELQSVLRNALLFSKGGEIKQQHLNIQIHQNASPIRAEFSPNRGGLDEKSLERRLILQALAENSGDKKAAAATLGITLRNLYTKLEAFGIPKKKAILLKFLVDEKIF